MSHPLRPPMRRAAGDGAWPTYAGSAELVGTSASGVTVYVDPSLGQPALGNAHQLLAAADAVVARNDQIFAIQSQPVSVILFALGGQTDGTGGADHGGCTFQSGGAIEVDVSYGSPERVIALFEAELSECAMGASLCGYSTGEALSRWCAAAVSDNALADFATAPTWAQDAMPDWVDQTEHTDQDPDSIGCGMAFISWLLSRGPTLAQLAQGMVALGDAGTLAQLYEGLTGRPAADAWPAFIAAVQALNAPIGNDDPFGALPGVQAQLGGAVSPTSG